MARPRTLALGLVVASMALSIPWLGLVTLPALIWGALPLVVRPGLLPKRWPPEYAAFLETANVQLAIAYAVAVTGGIDSAGLPFMAFPLLGFAARFPMPGVVAGTTWCVLTFAASVVIADPSGVTADPTRPLGWIAALIGMATLMAGMISSDRHHRAVSATDQLTGLLNRRSLEERFEELAGDRPAGLVLLDLDRFKAINDNLGHDRGDDVLRDIGSVLTRLCAGDARATPYRLGGEEFALFVTGPDPGAPWGYGEAARQAIATARPADLPVTASFGTAWIPGGATFHGLYTIADPALYRAKRSGRNCGARGATAGDGAVSRDATRV